MSQPQYCDECDFCDGLYVNFGNDPIKIRMYHGNFTCPECNASRSITREQVVKDLRELYKDENWGAIEDQVWYQDYLKRFI